MLVPVGGQNLFTPLAADFDKYSFSGPDAAFKTFSPSSTLRIAAIHLPPASEAGRFRPCLLAMRCMGTCGSGTSPWMTFAAPALAGQRAVRMPTDDDGPCSGRGLTCAPNPILTPPHTAAAGRRDTNHLVAEGTVIHLELGYTRLITAGRPACCIYCITIQYT